MKYNMKQMCVELQCTLTTGKLHATVLLVQSFTAHMPLLTATSAFGLQRRRWSSQQCYLHCLSTVTATHTPV